MNKFYCILNRNIQIIALFFGVLFVVFYFNSVLAIEYGGIGGRPAYPQANNPRTESIFIHTLEPGETKEEGVFIINNTANRKEIMVYAVDSAPSTGGTFACKQFAEESDSVGAWIKLNKSEVILESGSKELVPFTITAPSNASVGEHNGCIIVQEKKALSEEPGVQLSVRTGLRVVVTIPGQTVRKLEIKDFILNEDSEKGLFILHPFVSNVGNVSIDAEVKVVTKNIFGQVISNHGGNYPILRGQTSDWNFELRRPFWGGWYKSELMVDYDENLEASVGIQSGKPLTTLYGPQITFFSFPTIGGLVIEIAILLLLIVGLLLLFLAKKRQRWIKENWVDYKINSGDDINSLAKNLNVSWKLIVKVNKLKPPYVIVLGEKIKLPPKK